MRERTARTAAAVASAVATLALALVAACDGSRLAGDQSEGAAPTWGSTSGNALRGGAARAYRWSVETTLAPVGPSASPPTQVAWSGTLNVRVAPRTPGSAVAVQFVPTSVRVGERAEPRMAEAFAAPFVLEMDSRGRMGRVRFPAGLAPVDRRALENAIRALEVITQEHAISAWEAVQADGNGEYVASYERNAEGELVKRKLRYVAQTGGFSAAIEKSHLRARLDPEGPWLARANGEERIAFAINGRVLARAEARVALEPLASPPAPGLALWDDAALAALAAQPASPAADDPGRRTDSSWEAAQLERVRAAFRKEGTTLDTLMAKLVASGGDVAQVRRIADYLRAFPRQARRVPALVQRLERRVGSELLAALQAAGGPEAQAALAEVFESATQQEAKRIRALLALAAVSAPTPAAVQRVSRLAGGGRGGAVESTALLVSGALAARATEDVRAGVTGQLEARLRGATGTEEQRQILLALANARATLGREAVGPMLRSTDVRVREAALLVASAGGDDRSLDDVQDVLQTDREARVRRAAMQGLDWRGPDPRGNDIVRRALEQAWEPDPQIRSEMVAYLARHMSRFPRNRAVLAQHFHREADRRVAIAILNALADEVTR